MHLSRKSVTQWHGEAKTQRILNVTLGVLNSSKGRHIYLHDGFVVSFVQICLVLQDCYVY